MYFSHKPADIRSQRLQPNKRRDKAAVKHLRRQRAKELNQNQNNQNERLIVIKPLHNARLAQLMRTSEGSITSKHAPPTTRKKNTKVTSQLNSTHSVQNQIDHAECEDTTPNNLQSANETTIYKRKDINIQNFMRGNKTQNATVGNDSIGHNTIRQFSKLAFIKVLFADLN